MNYYAVDRVGNREETQIKTFSIIDSTIAEFGSISGYVYKDKNNNEELDDGDKLKKNQKVYLDLNNDGKLQKKNEPFVKTDKEGYYEFNELEKGTYIVRIKGKKKNRKLITPLEKYYEVELERGEEIIDKNFGIGKKKYKNWQW